MNDVNNVGVLDAAKCDSVLDRHPSHCDRRRIGAASEILTLETHLQVGGFGGRGHPKNNAGFNSTSQRGG